jgi:hypothetical protein
LSGYDPHVAVLTAGHADCVAGSPVDPAIRIFETPPSLSWRRCRVFVTAGLDTDLTN